MEQYISRFRAAVVVELTQSRSLIVGLLLALSGGAQVGQGAHQVSGPAHPSTASVTVTPQAGYEPVNAHHIQPEKLAAEGLKYLGAGDNDKARRLFSAAIKFDPSNGYDHLLLGVSLHLQFRATGSTELRDQALAGYQIAARYIPTDPRPSLQIGRLYLDTRQFDNASRAFSAGLEIKPADPDLLYGLGRSADLGIPVWPER